MKTQRELLFMIACKLSGGPGAGLLKTLGQKTPFDDVLDRPISDEEFERQLEVMERNWPKTFGHTSRGSLEKPESWGLDN